MGTTLRKKPSAHQYSYDPQAEKNVVHQPATVFNAASLSLSSEACGSGIALDEMLAGEGQTLMPFIAA